MGRCSRIPARARCSALLTELTESPSRSATSLAGQPITSRRISAARGRGARCCTATTYASSMVSRASALVSGSSARSAGSSSRRLSGRAATTSPRRRSPDRGAAGRAGRGRRWSRSGRPGAHRRASFVRRSGAPGLEERVLHRVLGILERPEHPVAVDVQFPLGAARPAPRTSPRPCLPGWSHLPPRCACRSHRPSSLRRVLSPV